VPTYQYSCNDCGHFFETVQSFSDDSLTVCPECEGRLRKIFNAVGVVFKGSGFYRTDSRKDPAKSEASGNGSGSSAEKKAKESTPASSSTPSASSSSSSTTPSPAA
jgi:putative FmdB family regulatory protein